MSYEKLKYISIKDDRVFLTLASNNVVPQTYEKCEYIAKNVSLDYKLLTLCKDIIQGNIHPIGSCNMSLKDLTERESDRYVYARKNFEHLNDFAMMNPYRNEDMLNLYDNISKQILDFRATELFNLAFADKVKGITRICDYENKSYTDNLRKIDERIDKVFGSGIEKSREQNLKDRTKHLLIELCQIAPQIGLSDMVSYFGDYDVYEVSLNKTNEEVWNAVVDKLKEIGKNEPFNEHYKFYVEHLVNYPPTYETVNSMDTHLKCLTHKGNMIDQYADMLKNKEKDEVEEEIER